MATMLEQALALAARGFHVFPLIAGKKLPKIKEWQIKATIDEDTIRTWWTDSVMEMSQEYNIGICTTRYGTGKALIVIDVDDKNGKSGSTELLSLELDGREFPPTLEARTASGGRHIYYVSDDPVRQGTNVLGPGLDIRSRGGFVVAPGSEVELGSYTFEDPDTEPAPAPTWLIDFCGIDRSGHKETSAPIVEGIDQGRAEARAIEYLQNSPPVTPGERNHKGYTAACRVKDFGVDQPGCLALMLEHWRCEPMLDPGELEHVVRSAYAYGQNSAGSAAPEAVFDKVNVDEESLHPFEKLNREYAFIKKGASVLHETTDHKGRFIAEHLDPREMNVIFANKPFPVGKTTKPLSAAWLEYGGRREYDGIVFSPGLDAGARWYNLWRGFRVQPADVASHPSLSMFLEHAKQNVCGGDDGLFRWLMGFFAHMIQKPWEKPLVALVFQGRKGAGKNALVERVGHLLGHHFMVADDPRYLTDKFNAHFESCLMIALDEAHWAGDKKAEGKLKGLVTGSEHLIERKFGEVFRVDNLVRVVIIGNESWLVPATIDERRWAVFSVGDGRLQDREFFKTMRVGMEQGGYSHLLRYLMDFDLSTVDVNRAPDTEALTEQKTASLNLPHQWWLDCLSDGRLLGADMDGWPETVDTERFRSAFRRYYRERNVRARMPDDRQFSKDLGLCAPSLHKVRARRDTQRIYVFQLPPLETAREEWDAFIGHPTDWS